MCNVGTLRPGQIRSFDVGYVINPDYVACTALGESTVTACATISAEQPDPNLVNNTDCDSDLVKDRSDLRITKV